MGKHIMMNLKGGGGVVLVHQKKNQRLRGPLNFSVRLEKQTLPELRGMGVSDGINRSWGKKKTIVGRHQKLNQRKGGGRQTLVGV